MYRRGKGTMEKHVLMLLLVMCPSLCKARLEDLANIDHKCSNGLRLSAFWLKQEPYIFLSQQHTREEKQEEQVNASEATTLTGILDTVLLRVIRRCCHENTSLDYTKSSCGPASLDELLSKQNFDFIVPVGSHWGASSVRLFPFVGVFESPGVAVLTKGNVSDAQLLLSVLQAWPILVFILVSASLAGIIMWLLERKSNAEQFPLSYTHGVFEGFWWAFITMTTVGYGDKAPKTAAGKFLGHVWMLAGLIIVTMFISIITTSFTSVSLHGKSNLRGVTVSAVNHSEEYKLAIRELARVTALHSSEEALEFVIDRKVEGAVVDIHGLKHHINILSKHNIQVAKILTNHVVYGAILTPNSSRFQRCFREYLANEEQSLFQLLAENTGAPQEKISVTDDYFGSGGIFSVAVYSGLSLSVVLFAVGIGWEIYKKTANKKQQSSECLDKGGRSGNQDVSMEQHQHEAHTNGSMSLDDRDSDTCSSLSLAMVSKLNARFAFCHQPAEQLVSKHCLEVMRMDQEFNKFRRSWEVKRSKLLAEYEKGESQRPTMLCPVPTTSAELKTTSHE